jgi:hypothetical protein
VGTSLYGSLFLASETKLSQVIIRRGFVEFQITEAVLQPKKPTFIVSLQLDSNWVAAVVDIFPTSDEIFEPIVSVKGVLSILQEFTNW